MLSFRRRLVSALTCTLVAAFFVVTVPALTAGAVTAPIASPVSVGNGQVCATVSSAEVDCFGIGSNGQIGYFNGNNLYPSPERAGSFNNASSTSAGNNSTCAALFTGVVDCWGNDQSGQLGNGETEQYSTNPVSVDGISTATSVSMGTNFACATLSNGTVDCWGNGNSGDLGNGLTSEETSPVAVTGITNAVQVSAGYDFACALLSTGAIDCWGDNSVGALGTSNSSSELTDGVGAIANATEVSAGQDGVCALLATGSIDCWGGNTDGDLGNGATTPSSGPVSVSDITSGATSVSMGTYFACAVVSGAAECWGEGASGQLGNGSDSNSDIPVPVSTLTDVTAVSAGLTACAVTSGAAVSCWGTNNWDELGTYGGGSSDVPVLINGLDAVTPEPTYTVSYNAEGGTTESSQSFTVGGSGLTLPTPSLTGYTFDGWYTAPTGGTLESSPYSPSASTTLYAQWTADVYPVSFNAEGGTTESTQNFTVGGSALTLPTPTSTGYAFNGWYTAPTGGTLKSSPYSPTGSGTLYAQWTADTYTVTLNADGGNVTPASEPFTVGGASVTLPSPSLTDDSFSGWYTAPTGGTLVTSPYTPTASTTLYAQWHRNSVFVTLNAGSGSVSPSGETFSLGSSPLTLPTPTYTGYKFLGWFSAATGGSLESSPYTPTTSTTLYAQWAPNTYVVTYDATGGRVVPADATFTFGESALTLATATRSGYRFDGWYSAPTGGSPQSSPYTPSVSVTLYAEWTPNVPTKPSDVTISRSRNVVSVHWTTVDNASHYVCTLTRGTSVQRSTTTTNHCSFKVPAARSTYRVSVVATNTAGTSGASVANLAR